MAVGDFLTLCGAVIIVFLGGRAVARQTWDAWLKPLVSKVFPSRPAEIMSSAPITAPSLPVSPRTDALADGRTPILKPVTVDICKALRTHKFTRDEARAFLHPLGWSLGNDTWAQAQPTEDDPYVTPIVGRPTNATFRETGELKYEGPPQS